jgi:hypothetical protein
MDLISVKMDKRLEREEALANEPENRRREFEEQQALKESPLPQWYRGVRRSTQRGVKFIRWLRNYLFLEAPPAPTPIKTTHHARNFKPAKNRQFHSGADNYWSGAEKWQSLT